MKYASLILFCAICAAAQTPVPPWTRGANNPAAEKGVVFQAPDIDNIPDLHGNPNNARLVLFVGGNQFMVMPALIRAFEQQHPELHGAIFYETLPPGILRRQIEEHGRVTLGNFTLETHADVYEAGASALSEMEEAGIVESPVFYAVNNLEIMVRKGNPLHVRSLTDLGGKTIRLAMPNPEWEGVARQIEMALRRAGGGALVDRVMKQKVADGSTYLTQIHHRQTPMRILDGRSDAGVTWASEVRFQQQIGNAIEGVEIPAAQNAQGSYAAAVVKDTPHRAAALAWLGFLKSAEAQRAYAEYGFRPVVTQ